MKEQFEKISLLFPAATIEVHGDTSGLTNNVKGKFRDITYDAILTITAGDIGDKMERYEQLVISMILDQRAWIRDPSHLRVIDDTNAVESLRIAEEAKERAISF